MPTGSCGIRSTAGSSSWGIGWSLVLSPLALLPTAFLGATFELKSRFEERLLEERYPGYAAYRTRVWWRLVPWVH